MSKILRSNIDNLKKKLKTKSITDKTTQATKNRLGQIIQLYTDRKISKVSTAENFIKGLTSTDKKHMTKLLRISKTTLKIGKTQHP